jgi:SpoVK/Ycf46/Vps4 family AAA+-type ATPase
MRKSIFAGNNVVRDLQFPESPDAIGGYLKAKQYVELLAKYVKGEKSKRIKIKGALFVGPPGTGKSRLLTAIPGMLGLPGFELDVNAALGQFQGQSESALKEAIARAKKLAPCVLCIDEINRSLCRREAA